MAEMDGKIESLRKALRAKVRMGKHEILHCVLYVEKLCMYISYKIGMLKFVQMMYITYQD